MDNLVADFTIENNEPLTLDYELTNSNIDCVFEIYAAGTDWGSIVGTLSNQTDLQEALDLKADKSTVQADFEAINDTITENYTTLDNKIDSVQTALLGDISVLSGTVISNNTVVNNRIDTTNTNLSNLQTTVSDNYTTITNRINTLEFSTETDIEALNTQLSDLADSVLDKYSDLNGKITTLSDTVTNNYTTLDNKINTVQESLSEDVSSINDDLGALSQTVTNNYSTLGGDINTLETTVNSNYTTLDTKIDDSVSRLEGDIATLSNTVSGNYTALNNAITTSASTINSRIDNEVDDLNAAITAEASTREDADNNLQSQIDAITAASNVTDIVGTYAQLEAYDTTTLQNNDIVKVLSDESRDNETTYYRWVITDGVGTWVFIGEEGPYYTKSEADSAFVPQTRTINDKPLSGNVTLTYSDVNALPDTTVIGNGVLALQQNGVVVDTFSANATVDKVINFEVPTEEEIAKKLTGYYRTVDWIDIDLPEFPDESETVYDWTYVDEADSTKVQGFHLVDIE